MESPHSTPPTASNSRADETVQQRLTTARQDPTQPLYLGTTPDTDAPVTILRDDPFTPLLISGNIGTGKTTLCHHIATQQLTPDSGLCYVSGIGHAFDSPHPNGRATNSITPGPYQIPTDAVEAVPDDIGTDTTIHNVLLDSGTGTDAQTAVMSALIEELLINRHRQIGPDAAPYTLVLDGIGALIERDALYLRRLLAEARKLRLHVIIAGQTLTTLPPGVQRRLDTSVQTYITGQVARPDATHLARSYPTLTADALETLPHYQWWLCERTDEGLNETQFTSAPPLQRESTRDEAEAR